jgi:hypothetical protein
MTLEERRALQRLAGVPRGIVKTLMLAHGFTEELIADLVLYGLATVLLDIARIGKQTIEIELVMITDAGRKAIWNHDPPNSSRFYPAIRQGRSGGNIG